MKVLPGDAEARPASYDATLNAAAARPCPMRFPLLPPRNDVSCLLAVLSKTLILQQLAPCRAIVTTRRPSRVASRPIVGDAASIAGLDVLLARSTTAS